jgi:Zn-dependent protease
MDRTGVVNERPPSDRYREPMEPWTDEERAALERWREQQLRSYREQPGPYDDAEIRGYDPIHPGGTNWRAILRRIWAPIAVVLGLAVKFGAFAIKFFGIFISVGGYALLWGWPFGVGFVLMILVHELGHFVEARRQGLHPALPVFVPFMGAYVAIKDSFFDPIRNTLVALAGPLAGGLAAVAAWGLGEAYDSNLLRALAYTGFLLNLVNLAPVWIFDGAVAWRSLSWLRRERDPRWVLVAVLYVGLAALLVAGMVLTHVEQNRL